MKTIKSIGLVILVLGVAIFTISPLLGTYQLDQTTFDSYAASKGLKSELFLQGMKENVIGKELGAIGFSQAIANTLNAANEIHKANQEWDKVFWDDPYKQVALELMKPVGKGPVAENNLLFFFLTFGLAILGGLMFVLPDVALLGGPGIKNNGIYQNAVTNRGWVAYIVFAWLVGFYILLYFYPSFIVSWVYPVDPLSKALSGNAASQWFLYGTMYTSVMLVMGVRMYVKYRHNMYQMVRTTSVLFFQLGFAFLIPELLVRFNMPYMDFKNAWPLDYDFFFEWNINSLVASGNIGIFMLGWGIALTAIIVPVLVYFYGKRWYCSWVCGCGGLAETLGDPYRQHSDKTLKAWKIERWLIHGVLVFAVIMTIGVLYTYFTGSSQFVGMDSFKVREYYGFLIGSVFSGVIGTGFYPVMGNRVWCRFGCPLAAYMGLVQKFKSRFRITTNGGQCISCGNCSTYCEQGIDVRWYAQRGQNIVRSSCVGCGVCAAVCPRGVLKLENGANDNASRMEAPALIIGNEGIKVEA